MSGEPKAGDYLFAVLPNEFREGEYQIAVVEKAFWERNGCLNDQSPPVGHLLPKGAAEAMGSIFEYPNKHQSPEEIAKDVLDCGFQWNEKLQEAMAPDYTRQIKEQAVQAAKSINVQLASGNQPQSAVTVFLDLDGVLSDFDAHAKAEGKYKDNGKVNWDALDYEWWVSMPECEGAKAFYDQVSREHTTKFLTAPVLSEECFSGKANWVQSFADGNKFSLMDLIICPSRDKQYLAGENRILIDDRENNVKAWEEAGGIGIHHKGDFKETLEKLSQAVAKVEEKQEGFAAKVRPATERQAAKSLPGF